ncbi:MAG: sugar-binding domain-containing protein, partial [Verrucomicrobiota bacterium]
MNIIPLLALVLAVLAIPMQHGFAETEALRQVKSLDGEWEIIFDPSNEGRELDWSKEATFTLHEDRRVIEVPSSWELIEKDYEGVAFYGYKFFVPESWKDKILYLQFDAVNYIAEVFVNDMPVDRHEGGYGPFEIRVEDAIKPGEENFVSLRVIGPIVAQDKVIDGIGWSDMPHWRGAITGGIWQSVRLIATGNVRVDDVFVQPQLADDTAKVEITLDNKGRRAVEREVTLTIGSQQKSKKLHLKPGVTKLDWTLSIPEARYWSPEDPYRYTATVKVDGSDEMSVTFGMREFTIEGMQFMLNGEPIYLKAAFFEGLYPNKLAYPDSEEMARREIQLAKDAGFNIIRPWRKPPPPMWLDLCDEMGMMVIGGMPIECMRRWPTATPAMKGRIEQTIRSAVMRDRNRACIIQWELFNEIERPALQRLKHPMSKLTRSLDPTRMILDESGGYGGGAHVYLPYSYEADPFNDVHTYPGFPVRDEVYDRHLTIGKTPEELEAEGLEAASFFSKTRPGLLTVISEIGYGSLPDLVDNNERFAREGNPLVPPYRYHKQLAEWMAGALRDSGMDEVYPDLQSFCLAQQEIHADATKIMIEMSRSNTKVGGYCVHALTGGDWVLGAGLLDLFRNPKKSYFAAKEANQPRYLALRLRPRNLFAGENADIQVKGFNDLKPISGKLSIEVVDADKKKVWDKTVSVDMATGTTKLFVENMSTQGLSGDYQAKVRLINESGKLVTENAVGFSVFAAKDLEVPKVTVALIDTQNLIRPFLGEKGITFQPFTADTPVSMPVIVSNCYVFNDQDKQRLQELEGFVKKGGNAVIMDVFPQDGPSWYRPELKLNNPYLPFEMTAIKGTGYWIGVSHIVREHPVFEGLPSNQMMDQYYANIWTEDSLKGQDGNYIVGAVSHGWHDQDF